MPKVPKHHHQQHLWPPCSIQLRWIRDLDAKPNLPKRLFWHLRLDFTKFYTSVVAQGCTDSGIGSMPGPTNISAGNISTGKIIVQNPALFKFCFTVNMALQATHRIQLGAATCYTTATCYSSVGITNEGEASSLHIFWSTVGEVPRMVAANRPSKESQGLQMKLLTGKPIPALDRCLTKYLTWQWRSKSLAFGSKRGGRAITKEIGFKRARNCMFSASAML